MKQKELLDKLISIPSYVDKRCDESDISDFLYDYLKAAFPASKVVKQAVEGKRTNIVLYSKSLETVKYVIVGHIDTVQPRVGWVTDPFKPVEKEGWLFGLGAADMKGSLATFIAALQAAGLPNNMLLLCYVDEEYDFKGMRQFIRDYKSKIDPKFVLSLDGGGPDIGYACRGLGEISGVVIGRTGHSSNPANGVNAIIALYESYRAVVCKYGKQRDKQLGKTSFNLAYVNGGLCLDRVDGKIVLGMEGNNIPNYCQFVLEARLTGKTTMKAVVQDLASELKSKNCSLEDVVVRHDITAWLTKTSELAWLKKLVQKEYGASRRISYTSPRNRGYVDTQMLWEAFNKVSCATLGVGPTQNAHAPNERVSVEGLNKGLEYYKRIIESMKSRRR